MSPPGAAAPTPTAITGTQHTNAETKRRANPRTSTKKVLAARVIRAMKAHDLKPQGYQVRGLVATLIANRDEPTDEAITAELMKAPWFPKPRIRRHGVGGPGWRVTS